MQDTLNNLIESGELCSEAYEADRWQNRVRAFLRQAFSNAESSRFDELSVGENVFDDVASQIGFLSALALETPAPISSSRPSESDTPGHSETSSRVFVVHGRELGSQETVCRYLEHLGLDPVVLHEQPNEGQTIIEKFERHADVSFAVVLLTPDDVGALAGQVNSLRPRARQNVVLELGYFLGSLGRSRVCALLKDDVEIPSDYDAILYIRLDELGAWRETLKDELRQAGLPIAGSQVKNGTAGP